MDTFYFRLIRSFPLFLDIHTADSYQYEISH